MARDDYTGSPKWRVGDAVRTPDHKSGWVGETSGNGDGLVGVRGTDGDRWRDCVKERIVGIPGYDEGDLKRWAD
jgi:hypothetical protein